MNLALSFRRAELFDLPALAALDAACFPRSWDEAHLRAEMERTHLRFDVVESDGVPIGFAAFQIVGDEAELQRLAVAPALQGHGIGRQLLTYSLAELQDAGIAACHLEVRADNRWAIQLYQRHGFSRKGRRTAYYGDGTDALLMSIDFRPSTG